MEVEIIGVGTISPEGSIPFPYAPKVVVLPDRLKDKILWPEEVEYGEYLYNMRLKELRQEFLNARTWMQRKSIYRDIEWMYKNKEKIIQEIEEAVSRAREIARAYLYAGTIEFNDEIRKSVPEINLDEIDVGMECEGEIESGSFCVNDWNCLSYTYGEKECEGSNALEFEWGRIEFTKKKSREVHDAEHYTFYNNWSKVTDAKITVSPGFKVIQEEYRSSYDTFYHYYRDSEYSKTIIAVSELPVTRVKWSSDIHTFIDGGKTSGDSEYINEAWIFPENARVVMLEASEGRELSGSGYNEWKWYDLHIL